MFLTDALGGAGAAGLAVGWLILRCAGVPFSRRRIVIRWAILFAVPYASLVALLGGVSAGVVGVAAILAGMIGYCAFMARLKGDGRH